VNFVVAQERIDLGLRAGAVLFHHVQVTAASPALRSEIADEVKTIRTRFADLATVRATPQVLGFREILRKVGSNPRKDQPSVERLLSFVLKRGDLPTVNSLVDAYNLVSIRSLCSLGAHDFDVIAPPIALRLLTGSESFTPLRHSAETSVIAGEFGYVDARDRVLCRLDVLQAQFSKVTTATVNALLIVEGTMAHQVEVLQEAFADGMDVVCRRWGGEAEVVCRPDWTT